MRQEHAAHTSLGYTKASRLRSRSRTASAVRGVQAARYSHPHASSTGEWGAHVFHRGFLEAAPCALGGAQVCVGRLVDSCGPKKQLPQTAWPRAPCNVCGSPGTGGGEADLGLH
eukprot:882468-Prymnesium_polylepis.1